MDLNSLDIAVAWTLVESTNDPSTLAIFSTSPHPLIRYIVAQNPNAYKKTLTVLSTDSSADVKQAIAANPSTPLPVLKRYLKKHEDREFILKPLLSNPALPLELVSDYSVDQYKINLANRLPADKQEAYAQLIPTFTGTVKELLDLLDSIR